MPIFRRTSRVTMLVSAGEYVAGRRYRIPRHAADALIVKGYATGKLSRGYSDEERQAIRHNAQSVRV